VVGKTMDTTLAWIDALVDGRPPPACKAALPACAQ
jgi:hypothetical protein